MKSLSIIHHEHYVQVVMVRLRNTIALMVRSASEELVSSSSAIDSISTEWNACSLEVLSHSPTDPNSIDSPLVVIGCYQLIENRANVEETSVAETNVEHSNSSNGLQQQRMGQLRLYTIHSSPLRTSNPYSLGTTPQITTLKDDGGGGILDMKWLPKPIRLGTLDSRKPTRSILAAALSSGSIRLYSLEEGEDVPHGHHQLKCITSSSSPPTLSVPNLCLSLDWEYSEEPWTPSSTQLVSSYSNGQVAIHTAQWDPFCNGTIPSCTLDETLRFEAHTLFQEPSEVWTCCWCRCTSGMVSILSGADDCTLKGWDTRVGTQNGPLFCLREHEAGVTALSWHPREPYLFASGSYDEGVRIWDIRVISNQFQRPPKPMAKVHSCGGGIWRLKWHPHDSTQLLVAAMHGGCHVVSIEALLNDDQTPPILHPQDTPIGIVSSFSEHQSMVYGADWVPIPYTTNDQTSELRYMVASCSFYDQKAFLWDPFSSPHLNVSEDGIRQQYGI